MHFLSHYYVDRNKNNPLFVAGAMLPDIAPHFTKTYNKNIRNKSLNITGNEFDVHLGVLRHFEADAVFHNSQAFANSCKSIKQRLTETGLDKEKYRFWFLSHIATEVILDRILIINNPELVDEYYKVLNTVDILQLGGYLNFIVTNGDKNKILSNFIKFLEVRFLRYFTNTEGAAEGIVRTMLRATGVAFNEEDKQRLIGALHNIENDMRYSGEKLLEV